MQNEINIDDLLVKRGLTIPELAKKVGLGWRTIYRYRAGEAKPSKSVLILLNLVDKGVI